MVDIDQMDVADTLTGLLNEYDVDARLLQAEITESAVVGRCLRPPMRASNN